MIKSIMPGSGINVQGGTLSFPYVPTNSSNPIQGMLRVNNQDLQVFDGSTWLSVAMGYPTVELNGETQALLDWARTERNRQLTREARIKNNPALRKAWEAIERAQDNFDLLEKFVEYDHDTGQAESVQASP